MLRVVTILDRNSKSPSLLNQGKAALVKDKTHHFPILDFGGKQVLNFPSILPKIVAYFIRR